ncbi:MAG: chloride channel protein [Lachnospiraceae bacterium]|nr:chloride channel protein [Lachnospiraceae bacterium]
MDVMEKNKQIIEKLKIGTKRIYISFKWVVFAIITGAIVGGVALLFHKGLSYVTQLRGQHPWLLFLLPIGGLIIVGIYRFRKVEKDLGTNLVINAIHSEQDGVPWDMAPLIFVSTIITHLFGGSAGREGAALQVGGSLGSTLGKLFRFDSKDQHIMIMCGMSAAFSALFGTPMAAAIFSMEMISVGIMHYVAFVPCVISSLVAHSLAEYFHVRNELFPVEAIPDFNFQNALIFSCLAVLCAFLSILFCVTLHETEKLYKRLIKNPYLRVIAGGCIIILLTLIVGEQRYNGTGINIIEQCINGTVRPEDFILKIIFTALTLGAGYKGGEIVPSFFTGAAFGCLFGNIFNVSPTLCTAIGMVSLFCGVTNCPITSLLISFELFGYDGMPYFLLAVALSYMFSGYFGLYRSQKIVYSKYKSSYINRKTR